MSKLDWMHKFLLENLDLILSKDDRKETIRLKKKEFFNKNRLKSSENFTLKELAFNTLRYLIDNYQIKSIEDLSKYNESSSFINNYITKREIEALTGLIKPPQSQILSPSDLGKLSQQEFLRKTEEQFLEKARSIAETDLEKQRKKMIEEINRERKEFEALVRETEKKFEESTQLTSQLDDLSDIINPEDYILYKEPKEEKVSRINWWQQIGLLDDPFPTKLGLARIPESKYEKVVVTTPIFNEYLKIISDSPRMLYGKTFLIHGQFGAGKTTFLQYISYKLAPHRILPFYIVLDPIGDIDIIRQNFYSETFNLISTAMRQRGLDDPRPQGLMLDRRTMAELLTNLANESQIDGFTLTIDGLHKAESTLESTLEFVKQLQNFHEYMENYGVNLCIFIAGSPLWLRRITQNTAYSGSFYRIDEVPPISFDTAYSLMSKRIQAFKNPDVEVYIDKDSVRFAYDSVAEKQGGNVTFRSFLDYVIPRLEKGDYKEVGISVSVDLEVIRQIDRELMNSIIRDSYQYYKQATKEKTKLRQACSTALLQIFRNRYYGEWNHEFVQNKGAFFVLRNAGLIRRFNSRRGLGWTLSYEFVSILDNLLEQGYSPSIVFKAFSFESTAYPEKSLKRDAILENGKDFQAKWESEWPEIIPYISNFLEIHESISDNIDSVINNLCDDCKSSIIHLISCFQIALKNNDSPQQWLNTTWLDISILPIINSVMHQENILNSEKIEYYQRYCSSATVLLELLNQLLDANRLVNILTLHNGTEEMRALMKAGVYLTDGDFKNAIEAINSKIEERIRTIFHLAFSLHYGNDYIDRLPRHVQTRIQDVPRRGPIGLKRKIDENLFYHLSRSEYAEIINEKRNWDNFFKEIFSSNTRSRVVDMLQKTFALDNRKQHRNRVDYFRETREEIRKAIINADYILTALANAIQLSIRPNGFNQSLIGNNYQIKISYVDEKSANNNYMFIISKMKILDISNRLTSTKRKCNFAHESAITTLYNCSFSEYFIALSMLVRDNKIQIEKSPESRMYLQLIPT